MDSEPEYSSDEHHLITKIKELFSVIATEDFVIHERDEDSSFWIKLPHCMIHICDAGTLVKISFDITNPPNVVGNVVGKMIEFAPLQVLDNCYIIAESDSVIFGNTEIKEYISKLQKFKSFDCKEPILN